MGEGTMVDGRAVVVMIFGIIDSFGVTERFVTRSKKSS
jgi:hypothetical protein